MRGLRKCKMLESLQIVCLYNLLNERIQQFTKNVNTSSGENILNLRTNQMPSHMYQFFFFPRETFTFDPGVIREKAPVKRKVIREQFRQKSEREDRGLENSISVHKLRETKKLTPLGPRHSSFPGIEVFKN